MRELSVYLDQVLVGQLSQHKKGRLSFRYNADYLASKAAQAISCSLPLTDEIYEDDVCHAFFSGVLPEGESRQLIAKQLGFSEGNDFAFLEAIGGECAGAISFCPAGKVLSKKLDYLPLNDQQLVSIFEELPRNPLLAGQQDLRLSLAGAQSKVALKISCKEKLLPLQGSPSTHILKPAIKGFLGIVENEAYCMQLAKKIGLNVASAEACYVDDSAYLKVKRYDRKVNGDDIVRLHQEDFCQALAIPPELKYQCEGGPAYEDCFNVVRNFVSVPAKAQLQLLELIIFNFVIGNHDAHGKNFSLLYQNGKCLLAPGYDLLSTSIYPKLTEKQAMAVAGTYKPRYISRTRFLKLALQAGMSEILLEKKMQKLCQRIQKNYLLLASTHPIVDTIKKVVQKNLSKLMQS